MARSFDFIWVQVFKNGPVKICGRQPLKNSTKPILEFLDPFIARRLSFMTETSWRCFCQWWALGIFAGVHGSQVYFVLFCFTGFVVFIFIFFVLLLCKDCGSSLHVYNFFQGYKERHSKEIRKIRKANSESYCGDHT